MSAPPRLGPVTLAVASLDRSQQFYGERLGLRTLRHEGAALDLGTADGTMLLRLLEEPGAAPVPRTGRFGLFHVALLLPSRAALGACVQHLAAHRAPFGASDHLVSEALYLRDPDGLGLELYADRPCTQWVWDDDEVRMTTQALDLDGVAAAADGRWTGMPAGTTVGHIHLQVSSLGEAERFHRQTLSLQPVLRSYPGALFLAYDGYHHHVGCNTWGVGARTAGPGDARLVEWTLRAPPTVPVGVHVDPWGVQARVLPSDAA